MLFLPPPFILGASGSSLIQIITAASLTSNLKLCLDAADSASYTSGQSWLDRSGNGFDFFLGADGSATSTDPTFNGSTGGLSASEYFSVDGGDYFRYDTTNETFMNNLHKDGAVYSWLSVYWPAATGSDGALFGTAGGGSGPGVYIRNRAGVPPLLQVTNGSVAALTATATTNPNSAAWNAVGGSINENGGSVSFFYQNGAYNQVSSSDTFNAAYSSPSSSAAAFAMEILARGNASSPNDSGSRIALLAVWEGTALTKANFDTLYAAIKAARTGYSLP